MIDWSGETKFMQLTLTQLRQGLDDNYEDDDQHTDLGQELIVPCLKNTRHTLTIDFQYKILSLVFQLFKKKYKRTSENDSFASNDTKLCKCANNKYHQNPENGKETILGATIYINHENVICK